MDYLIPQIHTDSSKPITNGYTFTFYGGRNIDFLIMIGTNCNNNLAPMFNNINPLLLERAYIIKQAKESYLVH